MSNARTQQGEKGPAAVLLAESKADGAELASKGSPGTLHRGRGPHLLHEHPNSVQGSGQAGAFS